MVDKEKIIKGLEFCFSEDNGCVRCDGCAYENERVFGCACKLGKDALALLSEQQKTIDDLQYKLETLTKWRINNGAFD